MCLITRQKDPIILEEDLEVYKIINQLVYKNGVYYSAFIKGFEYKLNKLYSTTIEKASDHTSYFDNIVAEHYNLSDWRSIKEAIKKEEFFSYGQGFHSIVGKESIKRRTNSNFRLLSERRVVKCIIPKGSEIYYDETGLCVSSQIIVKKLLRKGRYK